MITVADMAAGRVPVPLVLQAVLFVSLLAFVSVWDLRYRIIPDRLQAGIALLSLLQFSPKNLLGILGAAPYLLVALLCEKEKGIGGGDGAGAWASGQSDSFLFGVDRICFVWCSRPLMGTASWKGRESPLSCGTVSGSRGCGCLWYEDGRTDSMKKKRWIAVCAAVPLVVLTAVIFCRKRSGCW